ncbi:Hsp33 family molecular chaperone HslO [Paenibacillus mucilaginosus]|uniref:33 kDa chaperonin n=3 Tax=Paenibacillus mucilaginosus TaxID=61624 RepID=H6NSE5_9BACL|nr:Hsp33 family molecular chaperone HslO [Paenibacillus mucilaginosus]AEI46063.1 HslO [Paenibacillus mucilaginosus KNP414]AFC33695.1 HslO [Paenibacillus mucilaginosus 3016]AFH66028.1 heat shock protein Hsp33 [Paenibacillus mucilaginosus K02]MCG7217903.1 Hsp33 family molecular chaperone HslO [Paenibacillus mucilaginosus]WDM27409.1 Hsp33 family molecular chaperone HslO [Paenibacillus mucilaginosus]
MQDYLIRATAYDGKVRAFAVHTRGIVEELRQRHQMTPTATAALGRTVSAALMMGAMLKGEEKLTVQIKGGGPIGQIVVDANAHGEVRGYVDNPEVDLPLNEIGKLDVRGAVGTDGFLYVIKDLGLKEPYRGSVPIVSGELGEDFTYYFAKSEQTNSAVALGVLIDVDYTVKTAGGFIIQLLPGLSDEEITQIEKELNALPPITKALDRGDTLEQILTTLLPGASILERRDDIRFQCKCSRERVEQTLISLGRSELQTILDEDGQAEVSCHFCNEKYAFTGEDLKGLIAAL